MSDFVIVRNSLGQEKRWSRETHKRLPKRMQAEWQIVGEAKGPLAPVKSGGAMAATFIPEEILEMQRGKAEAERATESAMISGEAVAHKPEATKPAQAEPAAPAKAAEPVKEPAKQPENQPEKKAEKPAKTDDLSALPNMGAKCAEALAAAGIDSFAKLIETPTPDINRVLEAANFLPKKAQVPGWKLKAAELASK